MALVSEHYVTYGTLVSFYFAVNLKRGGSNEIAKLNLGL